MGALRKMPFVTPLRVMSHPLGNVYRGLKSSDAGFAGFGEAYFTTIHYQQVKGWKKHTQMQMNLIVPVGEVCFYVYDEATARTAGYVLGAGNYARLTVPAGFWMAFKGLGNGLNLVLNVASIEHDVDDAMNVSLDSFPFEERL